MKDIDNEYALCQERALYFLGALDSAAETEFERHLAWCAGCLDDGDQLGPLLGGMAMLSGEEIDAVIREHGAETDGQDATAGQDSTLTGDGGISTNHHLNEHRSRSTQRLPGRPRASRPPVGPRGRMPRRVIVGVLAAVVVVFAVGIALLPSNHATIATQPAAVTAQGRQAATSMSVAVADNHGQVTIRTTVVGLQTGTRYRLYAVTTDGRSHVIAEWAGHPGAQDVVGELSMTVDELAFFTVTQLDGQVVVTARVLRSQPASPTR